MILFFPSPPNHENLKINHDAYADTFKIVIIHIHFEDNLCSRLYEQTRTIIHIVNPRNPFKCSQPGLRFNCEEQKHSCEGVYRQNTNHYKTSSDKSVPISWQQIFLQVVRQDMISRNHRALFSVDIWSTFSRLALLPGNRST